MNCGQSSYVIPPRFGELKTETNYRQLVEQNAKEIFNLRRQIREANLFRSDGPEYEAEWQQACNDFHENYDSLAFPGGAFSARHRMRAGDNHAIEYAIAFLEVRPYFYRSGYMYKEYMRVLRNCPLTSGQRKRYDRIREKYLLWRQNRKRNS